MDDEGENLTKAVRRLRDEVMADRRVDAEEAGMLLAFAEKHADNPRMAEFVPFLKQVLEDGVVDEDESEKLELYLDWLVREVADTKPETGFLGRLFGLNRNRTTAKTEVAAGVTTFMTMAYILAVNPNILSVAGMPRGGVFVATALAAVVGTLLMAFMANYPFVLAPGMGLNAFLTFGVCLGMGYSWQFALLAVFVEGLVFLALSLTPVREAIFNCIPLTLKKAVSAGIGLFICFIALQMSGVIVDNGKVLVQMVGFREVPFHSTGICALLALVGTVLTSVLLARRWKGAILIGIFATWGLGMLAQATGLYVPDPSADCGSLYPSFTLSDLAGTFRSFGDTFGAIFRPEDWTHTVGGRVVGSGWQLAFSLDFFVVMFAFFFVDLFDTLGTLIGVSMKGGFLGRDGRLPRISGALCADAVATAAGAVLGTSTTTTYVDSASGVMAGGRTGLTAVSAAALFAAALLFAPVFLAIPAFATAPALVVVGYMMLSSVSEINFSEPGEAIPAFLTVVAMPFAYSISDGIMWGVVSYTLVNLAAGRARKVHWIMYVLTVLFIAKYALM